jgi:hypothetical protein
VLYNAFGQNTWVVPLVADSGKYQSLALVEATNGHVIVGNPTSPSPQADAFAAYQAFLGGSAAPQAAGGAGVQSVGGIIDRLASANGRVYFTLRGRRELYELDAADPTVLLARSGDPVRFRASRDEASGRYAVTEFADAALTGPSH